MDSLGRQIRLNVMKGRIKHARHGPIPVRITKAGNKGFIVGGFGRMVCFAGQCASRTDTAISKLAHAIDHLSRIAAHQWMHVKVKVKLRMRVNDLLLPRINAAAHL